MAGPDVRTNPTHPIRSVRARGLLSFGPDAEAVELGPLNVIIGPNGSGKSNLLELLSLIGALPTDLREPLRRGGGALEWLWKGAHRNATASLQVEHYLAVWEPEPGNEVIHELEFGSDGTTLYVDHEEARSARSPSRTWTELRSPGSRLARRSRAEDTGEMEEIRHTCLGIRVYQDWDVRRGGRLRVRIELRSLIQFLDSDSTNIVTTHFEDEIGEGTIKDLSFNLNDLDAYKRKVERYLKENNNHTTIYKIRNNLQITETDIKELERMLFDQGSLGTKEQFVEAYGEQPLGRFIRSIVGLEAKVAKELFGKILGNQNLNARQIKFMDTIINYLNVKGVIDPALFFEPPFTDISSNGISDVFDDSTTDKIISLLDEINKKAEAA
jgi:energy-coupling factor transporter ATP-binding protein EcfA2